MGAKAWLAATAVFVAGASGAEPAKIAGARAVASGGEDSFSVTLLHGATGWEDYADGWRVELDDGTVLGVRVLMHPHVSEQPFTRSLSGVAVPDGVTRVFIRARTLVEGWGNDRFGVSLK